MTLVSPSNDDEGTLRNVVSNYLRQAGGGTPCSVLHRVEYPRSLE
jgi:hypothetical protein